MSLAFEEFQQRALPVVTPDRVDISFWSNGLGGEAAEEIEAAVACCIRIGKVQNVAKKIDRGVDPRGGDEHLEELDRLLLGEAGDVLFYLRQTLALRGFHLEDVARLTLTKLDAMRAAR